LEDLIIQNTPKTPQINFIVSSGLLEISGVSVPEDSVGFYTPIIKWLKDYSLNPSSETILSFKLSYINTSSLQTLYEILFILDKINKNGNKVLVEWYHIREDEDMKEVGEDLQEALSFQFSFFAVEQV
jgi:hypothetical protein